MWLERLVTLSCAVHKNNHASALKKQNHKHNHSFLRWMGSARAEGQGMCQEKKVKMLLFKEKKKKKTFTYTIFLVSAFIKLSSPPFLLETHRPAWLQDRVCCYPMCACSFSFCVHMWECVRMRGLDTNISDLPSLLALTYLDMLLCTPKPWCYISSGSKCLQITLSYRCRHMVLLCLYFQLAPN